MLKQFYVKCMQLIETILVETCSLAMMKPDFVLKAKQSDKILLNS